MYKRRPSRNSRMRAILCAILAAVTMAQCPTLPNCVYTDSSCATCLCQAGYEMVGGQCQACQLGYYKSGPGQTCSPLSKPTCPVNQYLVKGTRFANSACLDCMAPPGPSSYLIGGTECSWACMAGFSKN